MSNIICESCLCGCQIIPTQVLEEIDGRIKKFCIDDHPEIRNAVDSMILQGENEDCGLLGNCYDLICTNINQAVTEANEYNEANLGENKKYTEFVDSTYKSLIENRHFRLMYAAYIVHYIYALGHSNSSMTKDGAVNKGASGRFQTGQSSHISSRQNNEIAARQKAMAQKYMNTFEQKFLSPNIDNFPCIPKPVYDRCCCVVKDTCATDKKNCGRPKAVVL